MLTSCHILCQQYFGELFMERSLLSVLFLGTRSKIRPRQQKVFSVFAGSSKQSTLASSSSQAPSASTPIKTSSKSDDSLVSLAAVKKQLLTNKLSNVATSVTSRASALSSNMRWWPQHLFFSLFPYSRFPPARHLISALTGFFDWGLLTRWAQLLITCNYYLPSTPKDQSTTRAELTEYLNDNLNISVTFLSSIGPREFFPQPSKFLTTKFWPWPIGLIVVSCQSGQQKLMWGSSERFFP